MKEGESFSDGVTRTIADKLLYEDCQEAETCINKELIERGYLLKQYEFDALVSLVFNIGVNAFRKSTLLKLLKDGKFVEAAAQFQRWKYVKGKFKPGLLTRRYTEAAYFLGASDELVDHVYKH